MRFDRIVREYLNDFQDKCEAAWADGSTSVELATRPVVHTFLEQLVRTISSDVRVFHDTKAHSSRDRPDWRLQSRKSLGIYAYGDHKNLNLHSAFTLSDHEREQIQRYLQFECPIFVFDGIEFLFFGSTTDYPKRLALLHKPLPKRKRWADLPISSEIVDHLGRVLRSAAKQKWTEQRLVRQLALRARALSNSLERRLGAPPGSGMDREEERALTALRQLKDSLTRHHDPTLHSNRACADFVAQVVTFSLFYAHVAGNASNESPVEARERIVGFWKSDRDEAKKLLPFRAVSDDLAILLHPKGLLEDWYQDTATLLAYVEYRGRRSRPDDFHSLFEAFFEAFDHTTKFDRGAFYTPTILATWMARMSRDLIRQHFQSMGPAERLITIVDPCCGTGGILEAVLAISDRLFTESSRFVGFEILPAPYALAQYRLRDLVRTSVFKERFDILLTDTLADELLSEHGQSVNGIGMEREKAHRFATQPLHIVIGNPPSSDRVVSKSSRRAINALLDDFRPPRAERKSRQNIQKALNNEAMRFLRWGAERVQNAKSGILALAMPGSLASAPSYRWARKWLLNRFDAIYVLHLDRDARTGERTESLFNVLQARLVLFAVLKDATTRFRTTTTPRVGAVPSVGLLCEWDISTRSLKEKMQALSGAKTVSNFRQLAPRGPAYAFSRETGSDCTREWQMSWPMLGDSSEEGVFRSKCSGLKLSPTALLFHVDDRVLRRRSGEIGARSAATFSYSLDQLRATWWSGQRKQPRDEKLTTEVRDAIRQANEENTAIASYSYRPFVQGYVVLDDEVVAALGQTPGGGTRARPEVRAAFAQGAIGIAVAPTLIDLGPTLTRFASFAWSIPDNDLSARGNAMIYCDGFPVEKRAGKQWNDKVRSNVSERLRQAFGPNVNGDDVLFYVYAIVSSREYLSRFSAHLFSPSASSTPFRIPILKDRARRNRLSALGHSIADCERDDSQHRLTPSLKVKWFRSSGEFQLMADAEINSTDGTVQLRDSQGLKVLVSGVSASVLQLRIGGHDVVAKWLRERKFSYLRRAMTPDDVLSLVRLLSRIATQLDLIEKVDKILASSLNVNDMIASVMRA